MTPTATTLNLFTDTNIYLNFYSLSNEDLAELEKAFVLQRYGRVKLFLTEQVKDEFTRNRASKIATALRDFKKETFGNQIPQMAKGCGNYGDLMDFKDKYNKAKNLILKQIEQDAANESLKADTVINSIFAKSPAIKVSRDILLKVNVRMNKGNPPGKKGSFGDAINWEILLEVVPANEDLHIIADDGDYYSELGNDEVNSFLKKEWQAKKNADLYVYKRMSGFLKQHFPLARLANELEKELAIENLAKSGSFYSTHIAIAALNKFSDFTDLQINEIVKAYLSNTQINSIIEDEDVLEFILKLIEQNRAAIEPTNLTTLISLLPDDLETKVKERNPTLLERTARIKSS